MYRKGYVGKDKPQIDICMHKNNEGTQSALTIRQNKEWQIQVGTKCFNF